MIYTDTYYCTVCGWKVEQPTELKMTVEEFRKIFPQGLTQAFKHCLECKRSVARTQKIE
ncbi:hypothetical protein KKA15_04010 [Patescibacteria group bacterium]|nr:hypothetical protein [Patescibacteria group bacterium]